MWLNLSMLVTTTVSSQPQAALTNFDWLILKAYSRSSSDYMHVHIMVPPLFHNRFEWRKKNCTVHNHVVFLLTPKNLSNKVAAIYMPPSPHSPPGTNNKNRKTTRRCTSMCTNVEILTFHQNRRHIALLRMAAKVPSLLLSEPSHDCAFHIQAHGKVSVLRGGGGRIGKMMKIR